MKVRTKVRNVNEFKRKRRHYRSRRKIVGTPERPRLCVFRSLNHIYAQIVDDMNSRTLVSASSIKLGKASPPEGKSKKAFFSTEVGRMIAEAAKEKGITKVAFDRGGYLYHGRVRVLAEEARKNGLEF